MNLMNAWRDQLLEVLGAMGMRDVRLLRGEMGRTIWNAKEKAGLIEVQDRILESRQAFPGDCHPIRVRMWWLKVACGVLGLASNRPVAGGHVLSDSRQTHNRGNGEGGGIAIAGLDPAPL